MVRAGFSANRFLIAAAVGGSAIRYTQASAAAACDELPGEDLSALLQHSLHRHRQAPEESGPLGPEALAEFQQFYPSRELDERLYSWEMAALAKWDSIAAAINVNYMLAWGTLLGWRRHPHLCAIAGDRDTDIWIDEAGIKTLVALASTPGSNVSFLNEPGDKFLRPTIVVHPHYDQLNVEGSPRTTRWNCQGERQEEQYQKDVCGFIGPVARFIFNPKVFVDMFAYSMMDKDVVTQFTKENPEAGDNFECQDTYNGTKLLCAYPTPDFYTPLPATRKVQCGANTHPVAENEETLEELLMAFYGKDYLRPLA